MVDGTIHATLVVRCFVTAPMHAMEHPRAPRFKGARDSKEPCQFSLVFVISFSARLSC